MWAMVCTHGYARMDACGLTHALLPCIVFIYALGNASGFMHVYSYCTYLCASPMSSVGLISLHSLRTKRRQAGSAHSNSFSMCVRVRGPRHLGSVCISTQHTNAQIHCLVKTDSQGPWMYLCVCVRMCVCACVRVCVHSSPLAMRPVKVSTPAGGALGKPYHSETL